jgi:hypothetical protein
MWDVDNVLSVKLATAFHFVNNKNATSAVYALSWSLAVVINVGRNTMG